MTNSTSTKSLRLPLPAENARRHWTILLISTLLIQSLLYMGYPLGMAVDDDNQAAQSYMLGELARGNTMIGNIRYNTGYALMMSPFHSFTRALGQLGDRAFLLIQVVAYSTIPFMVYDMMRRRSKARTALITALVTLVDPFGLQWAHFILPGWLIAVALVLALWLAQLAWSASRSRRFAYIALAAVVLGMMTFARLNYAPLVALYGASFLLWRHIPLRQRVALLILVGTISSGLLGTYFLLIHVPSTGTRTLSCTQGTTILFSVTLSGNLITMSNGEHSAHYARLLTLPPTRDESKTLNLHQRWQNPGPWVSEAENNAFLAQPFEEPNEQVHITFPLELYWHLGPCATDRILQLVAIEALAASPVQHLLSTLREILDMLVQYNEGVAFPLQYLDQPDDISCQSEEVLGFCRATGGMYNGHRLWRPAVTVYSLLFPILNSLKFLTPIAIVAAFWRRDLLLMTVASLLVLGLCVIAISAAPEPRHFAMLAPLYSILIGWFLAQILERILASRSSGR